MSLFQLLGNQVSNLLNYTLLFYQGLRCVQNFNLPIVTPFVTTSKHQFINDIIERVLISGLGRIYQKAILQSEVFAIREEPIHYLLSNACEISITVFRV